MVVPTLMLMWREVGASSLAVLGFNLVIIPFNLRIGAVMIQKQQVILIIIVNNSELQTQMAWDTYTVFRDRPLKFSLHGFGFF